MPSATSKGFLGLSRGHAALALVGGMVLGGGYIALDAPKAEAPYEVPPAREMRMVFVGDLMFDRYIRTKLETLGSEQVLGGVATLLRGADMAVGNLEGPITADASVSRGTAVGDASNMRFTFATSTGALLHSYGFDLVSIGNNHILDFGPEGVHETAQWLRSAGISYVGDPREVAPEVVMQEAQGVRVAFLAYNDFLGPRADAVREAVASAQGADVVVVLAHWGEEYLPEPPERARSLGRSFIDAGADMVIGSHPHVVQPSEDYNGGRIYYSLGNFVFDQYWNPRVRCGKAVSVTVRKEGDDVGVSYEERDVGMERDGRTVLGCR